MRNEDSQVGFGETGKGISPNYQVTYPNGRTVTRRGSSHEVYEQTDAFDPGKISQPFAYADIQSALERCAR